MKRTEENIVSSFFYYMWCRWSREECDTVFGGMSEHFWSKWCRFADKTVHGAAECFYAELGDDSRRKLIARACQLYNGKQDLQPDEINKTLVETSNIFLYMTSEVSLRNYAEALVDIAYEAGAQGFRPTGNSRDTVDTIISWANEFTRKHQNTDWNEVEYLDSIYEFTDGKLKEYLK